MNYRSYLRVVIAATVLAVTAATAHGQPCYTCGGTGGTGTGGSYQAPSGGYGSGYWIGIGAGAAAGVGILAYAVHHHHVVQAQRASLVGCTQSVNGATSLVDDKNKQTIALSSLSSDVKPGERVQLVGRKTKDKSGKQVFKVEKLAKDYGPCTAESAANTTTP